MVAEREREKMAPVLEKQLPGAAGAGDNNNEEEEGQNLWQVLALLVSTTPRPVVASCREIK